MTNTSAAKTGFMLFALALLALETAPVKAGASFSSDAVGTVGSDFLNLGAGAKAMAMGGAYTAVAEDASAAYWNPAGLVQINQMSATFMRATYLEDITYQYAAYAHRLSPYSVIGVSMLATDIGKIEQTDTMNNSLGSFTPRDQAYALTYSRAILELSDRDHDVAIGVSAKYVTSKIVDRGYGYAVDLGLMTFNFTKIPYRLGFAVQNLGRGQKFDQNYDSLPLKIKVGGALSPFRNFLLASDIVFPKQNKFYFCLGTEVWAEPSDKSRISIRAGYNSQMSRIQGGLSGISFGAGVGLQYFTVDYAYVPMGELGSTHRFSLNFDFPFWSPVFQRKDPTVFTNVEEFIQPQQKTM